MKIILFFLVLFVVNIGCQKEQYLPNKDEINPSNLVKNTWYPNEVIMIDNKGRTVILSDNYTECSFNTKYIYTQDSICTIVNDCSNNTIEKKWYFKDDTTKIVIYDETKISEYFLIKLTEKEFVIELIDENIDFRTIYSYKTK